MFRFQISPIQIHNEDQNKKLVCRTRHIMQVIHKTYNIIHTSVNGEEAWEPFWHTPGPPMGDRRDKIEKPRKIKKIGRVSG